MEAHDGSQLLLAWQDGRVTLTGHDQVVVLGAAESADVSVRRNFASRIHARIERRKQEFVLIDHSTNGTFVQTEDERVTFVRRSEIRLWGAGWISLGEPLNSAAAIHFENV